MEGKSHIEDPYDIDSEVDDLILELKRGLREKMVEKPKVVLENTEFVKLMTDIGEIEKPKTLSEQLIEESMANSIKACDLKDFLKQENVL